MKEETIFTNHLSKETWEQNYKNAGEKSIDESFWRTAKHLASIEIDSPTWASKFYSILQNFQVTVGGRILSNAGTELGGTTFINCFVSAPGGEDQDSMEGIFRELRNQGLILKAEGGYGFCAGFLRPRGAFIGGIGNQTPGSIKFLEMWDKQSEIITLGGGKKSTNEKQKQKIRKGAQMVTMPIWHPDVIEFIEAKKTPGCLTKFNMSVLITNDFMDALDKDDDWIFYFPDYEADKIFYKKNWDGNINKWKSIGGKIKQYQTMKAKEVWDLIMTNTYTRNEPGVLFEDTINYWNNLYYNEYIMATNPCGEQCLPPGGCCLLGSINLTQFINKDFSNWDYRKLEEVIPVFVRMLDNVNDLSYVPLPEERDNLKQKRRIGIGVLGYGSALMMMKIRYGSKKALEMTEELESNIRNLCYIASCNLAKEKGAFPLFECDKYLNGAFISKLPLRIKKLIKEYGIRNSHLLSIQPTGNSSVLSNNVSNGLEPIFLHEYIRTVVQPLPPDGLYLPKNIDWKKKTFESDSKWQWKKEGDEDMLFVSFEDIIWKFDRNRGLTKEVSVMDYGVKFHKDNGTWDKDAEWACSTNDLSVDDHYKTMEVFAKYVDSSISKTTNIPFDYPYEDFKDFYLKVFKTGVIKGATTYRAGTMASVLSKKEEDKIVKVKSPKRPKSLLCDIHHFKYKNRNWTVLVGLLNEEPYEVFALRDKNISLNDEVKKANLVKAKNRYNIESVDGELIIDDIGDKFETSEEEVITRLISTSLRHGVDIEFIIAQLLKAKGTIHSFNHVLSRALKKYLNGREKLVAFKCEKCYSSNMRNDGGCATCLDCGHSSCG